MLDAIQDKMGIDNDEDSELADLEMETKPEDVLTEIERLQQLALKRKKRHRSKEEMGNTIIPLGKRFLLEAQLGISCRAYNLHFLWSRTLIATRILWKIKDATAYCLQQELPSAFFDKISL
ncbi:hypothetical protein CDG77_16055 [Nostoc sp. 'Peltigera membranacea cyanobiont' 213]|uniref:hypothetical protein n=1 Tax=Nostoc cyanobionts TaxID=3123326 RepID=UPI000B954F03|nr:MULTISPECIES: hypothetical protein [unclassified Nostoc]OYD91361.1 hypothetical protein CDG77_16055 [Nostoc sp. 'Peltigera membranacea cyanobiont' 213]OYE04043.1 hypothetical protein CDG79_15425 [Nostoc sp. 'Peltigera membranacea cyanobiont' 232]